MGYKELVEDLIKNAENEGNGIILRSREEARNVINRAMEKAEKIHLKNEEEFKKEVLKESERIRKSREKDLRILRLRDKEELVEAVLLRVEEKLKVFPGTRGYSVVARKLFKELKREVKGRRVTYRADSHSRKVLLRTLQPREIDFEDLPKNEWGGVEAVLDGGRVLLKNTLKARFMKNREALSMELGRWVEDDVGF